MEKMITTRVTEYAGGVYHPAQDSKFGGFIEFVASTDVTMTLTEDNNVKISINLDGQGVPYRMACGPGEEILIDIPNIKPDFVRITFIPIWKTNGCE